MKKNWQAQREEFEAQMKGFREQLDWMDEGNVRHFRREGNEPEMVDITAEIRADYQRHIESYEMLIKLIDEQIALGR